MFGMKCVVPITLQMNEIKGYFVLVETPRFPQCCSGTAVGLHGQTELQLCHD